jgi:hypothetical protein
MCPVFTLKRKNVTLLADDDEMPDFGPLHPLSVGPPMWMGPNPAGHSSVLQDPPVGAYVDDEQTVEVSHPVLKAKLNALITCAQGSSYTHA